MSLPLLDSERQTAIKAVMDSRPGRRVIAEWDVELIGLLLSVDPKVISADVKAIKDREPQKYWWCGNPWPRL
jgi:hypothetical protein